MIEGCFKPKLKHFRVPVLYKKETVFHISRNGMKFSDFTVIIHTHLHTTKFCTLTHVISKTKIIGRRNYTFLDLNLK